MSGNAREQLLSTYFAQSPQQPQQDLSALPRSPSAGARLLGTFYGQGPAESGTNLAAADKSYGYDISGVGESFARGLSSGVDDTQGLLYGLAAMAGSAADIPALEKWGMENYQRNQQEAAATAPQIGSLADIHSFGDFLDWGAAALGQGIPSVATSIAGGGVGGVIGKGVAKRILLKEALAGGIGEAAAAKLAEKTGEKALSRAAVMNMIEKSQFERAGKKVAGGTLLNKAIARGALAGAGASSWALNTGEIYTYLRDAGIDDPAIASGFGILTGALDLLPEAVLATKIYKQLIRDVGKEAVGKTIASGAERSMLPTLLKDVGVQTALEGATEGSQEYLKYVARALKDDKFDPNTKLALQGVLDSAAAGAIIGLAMGGGGGFIDAAVEKGKDRALRQLLKDRRGKAAGESTAPTGEDGGGAGGSGGAASTAAAGAGVTGFASTGSAASAEPVTDQPTSEPSAALAAQAERAAAGEKGAVLYPKGNERELQAALDQHPESIHLPLPQGMLWFANEQALQTALRIKATRNLSNEQFIGLFTDSADSNSDGTKAGTDGTVVATVDEAGNTITSTATTQENAAAVAQEQTQQARPADTVVQTTVAAELQKREDEKALEAHNQAEKTFAFGAPDKTAPPEQVIATQAEDTKLEALVNSAVDGTAPEWQTKRGTPYATSTAARKLASLLAAQPEAAKRLQDKHGGVSLTQAANQEIALRRSAPADREALVKMVHEADLGAMPPGERASLLERVVASKDPELRAAVNQKLDAAKRQMTLTLSTDEDGAPAVAAAPEPPADLMRRFFGYDENLQAPPERLSSANSDNLDANGKLVEDPFSNDEVVSEHEDTPVVEPDVGDHVEYVFANEQNSTPFKDKLSAQKAADWLTYLDRERLSSHEVVPVNPADEAAGYAIRKQTRVVDKDLIKDPTTGDERPWRARMTEMLMRSNRMATNPNDPNGADHAFNLLRLVQEYDNDGNPVGKPELKPYPVRLKDLLKIARHYLLSEGLDNYSDKTVSRKERARRELAQGLSLLLDLGDVPVLAGNKRQIVRFGLDANEMLTPERSYVKLTRPAQEQKAAAKTPALLGATVRTAAASQQELPFLSQSRRGVRPPQLRLRADQIVAWDYGQKPLRAGDLFTEPKAALGIEQDEKLRTKSRDERVALSAADARLEEIGATIKQLQGQLDELNRAREPKTLRAKAERAATIDSIESRITDLRDLQANATAQYIVTAGELDGGIGAFYGEYAEDGLSRALEAPPATAPFIDTVKDTQDLALSEEQLLTPLEQNAVMLAADSLNQQAGRLVSSVETAQRILSGTIFDGEDFTQHFDAVKERAHKLEERARQLVREAQTPRRGTALGSAVEGRIPSMESFDTASLYRGLLKAAQAQLAEARAAYQEGKAKGKSATPAAAPLEVFFNQIRNDKSDPAENLRKWRRKVQELDTAYRKALVHDQRNNDKASARWQALQAAVQRDKALTSVKRTGQETLVSQTPEGKALSPARRQERVMSGPSSEQETFNEGPDTKGERMALAQSTSRERQTKIPLSKRAVTAHFLGNTVKTAQAMEDASAFKDTRTLRAAERDAKMQARRGKTATAMWRSMMGLLKLDMGATFSDNMDALKKQMRDLYSQSAVDAFEAAYQRDKAQLLGKKGWVYFPDADHAFIHITQGVTSAEFVRVIAHEMGHAVTLRLYNALPIEVRSMLNEAHKKARSTQSFEEWMADQFVEWSRRTARPATAVGRALKSISGKLYRLWKMLSSKHELNQTFRQFMEGARRAAQGYPLHVVDPFYSQFKKLGLWADKNWVGLPQVNVLRFGDTALGTKPRPADRTRVFATFPKSDPDAHMHAQAFIESVGRNRKLGQEYGTGPADDLNLRSARQSAQWAPPAQSSQSILQAWKFGIKDIGDAYQVEGTVPMKSLIDDSQLPFDVSGDPERVKARAAARIAELEKEYPGRQFELDPETGWITTEEPLRLGQFFGYENPHAKGDNGTEFINTAIGKFKALHAAIKDKSNGYKTISAFLEYTKNHLTNTVVNRVHKIGNEHYSELMRTFLPSPGEKVTDAAGDSVPAGFYDQRARDYIQWEKRRKEALGLIDKLREDGVDVDLDLDSAWNPELFRKTRTYKALKPFLDSTIEYMRRNGLDVGYIEGYWSTVHDQDVLENALGDIKQALTQLYQADVEARKHAGLQEEYRSAAERDRDIAARVERLLNAMRETHASLPVDKVAQSAVENLIGGKRGVFASAILPRSLSLQERAVLHQFGVFITDPETVLHRYVHQMIDSAMFNRYFGDMGWMAERKKVADDATAGKTNRNPLDVKPEYGKRIKNLLEAGRRGSTNEDNAFVLDAVDALMGRYKRIRDKKVRDVIDGSLLYQSMRALTFVTLSSMPDVTMMLVRTGDSKVWWRNMRRDLVSTLRGKGAVWDAAHALGIIHETVESSLVEDMMAYNQAGFIKKMGFKFFKYIGLQRWTNAMRAMGAGLGIDSIKTWAENVAVDPFAAGSLEELGLTPADVARWRELGEPLYGQGTNDWESLRLGLNKNLTEADMQLVDRVSLAITRFANEATVHGNPAERPLWANSPMMKPLWYLKTFMYAFYQRILKRMWYEMQRRGLFAVAPTYSSAIAISFALGMFGMTLRDMLQYRMWGEEGYVEKLSPMDYWYQGAMRGGFTGPAQLLFDIRDAADRGRAPYSAVLGPALTQLSDIILYPVSKTLPQSIPVVAQVPALREPIKQGLKSVFQ